MIYNNIVVEAQLAENDTSMINTVVFPNDTMATMFSGAQITIPRNALIHQRVTESEDIFFKLNNNTCNISLHFRCGGPSGEFCC